MNAQQWQVDAQAQLEATEERLQKQIDKLEKRLAKLERAERLAKEQE